MKKTYGVILANIGISKGYGRLYIRFYDRNDIGQIPYINSLHLDINNYKDKSRFNYEELIKEHGVFIPFSNIVKNYNFTKKEFRIIYKIIKAHINDSYYRFYNKRTMTRYTIIGNKINILEQIGNEICNYDIYLFDLGHLLSFFSLEFKKKINP